MAPWLAQAESEIDRRISAAREGSRFAPNRALRDLQQVESEAMAAPPATRGEFMAQLSIARMRIGDKPGALALAEDLIAYARLQQDPATMARGLLTKAYVLFSMGERKASHVLAFEGETLANRTTDLPLRVQAAITSGQARAEQGNFPAALFKLQSAVDLAREIDEQGPLASALNALTVLYKQMHEYDKGFVVLDELLDVSAKLQSPGRMAIAKTTEYTLSLDSRQPKRGLSALLVVLDLQRKLDAKGMIANTLVNLSDSYLKQYDYAKTQQYANQAIAAARIINDNAIEATARINIGQALIGTGHLAEGKKVFASGLAVYEKAGSKPELQATLLEYGAALERAGDMGAAVAAYHRERAISNELFQQQRQQAVYELQEKYEAEKKQRQIELLSRENQVKSAELDNRRLQQRVWWLLALVFTLVTAVIGLLYRKVRHANVQLHVKNQELKQQSARDPLTGLYNRRHFQEFMRGHKHQPERRGSGVSGEDIVGALFLLDVDHFKHINDRYGHAAGDLVLKTISDCLHVLLRETDMIVRWGGEEFLAFLPAVPRGGVDDIARRVLNGISEQVIDYQEHQIQVNVSLGYAPYPLIPLDQPLPWERAVNLVDMALYLAKSHGRNRAYGVRRFDNFQHTSMEAVEQDLERAWRAGFVDLSVVLGGTPEQPPPANALLAVPDNVIILKPGAKRAGA
nr:tetratricopeptide repeat-containing diguanylate cyclase [Janthinobacterium agaricidamnosum]